MACCLFIAFLISQVLVFRDRIKRFFGLTSAEYNVDTSTRDRPKVQASSGRWKRGAALLLALSLALGTVVLLAWHAQHIAMWLTPSRPELVAGSPEMCRATPKLSEAARHAPHTMAD